MKLALALMPLLTVLSWASEDSVTILDRTEAAVADRMQTGVLNPILGAGRSSAFVRMTLIVKNDDDYSLRSGEGKTTRTLAPSGAAASSGSLSGFDLNPSTGSKAGDDDRTQEARQGVGKRNDRAAVSREYSDFKIVVLHDEKIPPKKLEDARRALLAIYGPELKSGDIRFQSAPFSPPKP